jgi:receptor-type tyrosine-protein phosphatase T
MDQACNSTTGDCGSCIAGRRGSICSELVPSDKKPDVPIGAIVGPIVAIIVLAVVVVIGVIVWRRRRHKKDVPGLGSENHYDEITETRFGNSERASKSSTDGQNGYVPKKPKPPVKAKPDLTQGQNGKPKSAKEGTYYNQVLGQSDNSISVQDLNNFIASHSKEFFQKQFASIPASSTATITVATSPANQHKNRYKNISAYDHSRVHLQMDSAKKHEDYINASYINGFKKQNKFIASQGPTKVILNDFVRMLWEQGTEVVIMLTNLIEEGKLKCEQYWPDDGQIKVGEITVNLTTTQIFADYTIRRLELHKKAEPVQTLTHFHFTTWPDKDVPTTAWGLVDLEKRMADITTDKPIVVHCSAGVGRTGTFIALHNVLEEIEETGHMNFVSTVQKLRNDRVFMVQTYEQYKFLHQATQIALVCKGTTVKESDLQDRIKILEGMSPAGQTNLEKEFNSLCLVCDDDDDDCEKVEEEQAEHMYYNSRMATNKMKNRFQNILPKEYYRPLLACTTEDMSDYINAVFVPSSERHDHQFLTQLPLPTTITDLWRLVTQYKVALIVALEKDMDSEDTTIGDYLPEGDKVTTSSIFNIKAESVESDVNWKVQKIIITKDTEADTGEMSVEAGNRDYSLSHLTCKSTNLNPGNLLALVRTIRTMKPVGEGRIVYMCRDGATFSGLVCTLSLLLARMDYDENVSVPLVLGALKAIRPQMIPTLDQYRLLYQVLQLFVETNNVYSNHGIARPIDVSAGL